MTRSQIAVLVSGIALAFGITFAVGCSGDSGSPTSDSETTGAVGVNDGTYGCGNALIRQQQAYCVVECANSDGGALESNGIKYCKTSDPSGLAGTVDAPCDCAASEHFPDMSETCGDDGQTCCAGRVCAEGLACGEDGLCATP